MDLDTLLGIFPTKQFRTETEFKPILEYIQELKKRLWNEKRYLRLKDFDMNTSQGVPCNKIFAFFAIRLSLTCSTDRSARKFMEEVIIILCLFRRFLNDRGYKFCKTDLHPGLINPEYCSSKRNPIQALLDGQSEFFLDCFPCYLSHILR